MGMFQDLPIRRKLAGVNLATMGLALLLLSVGFVVYEVMVFRHRLVRHMTAQAEIVGYNSASAIVFQDAEAAMKTLAALRAERQVLAGAIFLPDGANFATYRRKTFTGALPIELGVGGNGHQFATGRLIVRRNILVDGESIGSVGVLTDLHDLTSSIIRTAIIAVMVFLAAIAAALPVLARLQRVILDPISELARKARLVSEEQDYSVRATRTSSDELGLLVGAFNEMLTQIQRRDQELERARDEAESANRAKDEFLAVVSHELRTPLSPVLAWTHMLREGRLDPERSQHGLEVIERNVKSQAQLIEDLLDVSRIISGKLRLAVNITELAPVIEAAVESLRPTADMKEVRLQTILDGRPLFVAGDMERLKQIFWNLLSNAVKFTPKGGRVQVTARHVSSHIEVAVKDTGRGIDPAFLPHVFDRFRQADSSSTRAHGGLGLGLSIVRNLVELHGGKVRAESAGDGQGATFTVELPVAGVPSVAPEPSAPAIRSGSFQAPAVLQGLRVLAVDDDRDTLETIRVLLEHGGADVRVVSSAEAALNVLQEWHPDLLISDIGMPIEDGFTLIRKVRSLAPEQGGRVPALALTAYARVEDRLKVLSAGFQMHVAKPIEPVELMAVVGSLAEWAPKNPRSQA